MIKYHDTIEELPSCSAENFFVGWPVRPSDEQFRAILEHSFARVLAIETGSGDLVGFVTAISDGVFAAFIPLLEVRASHQRRGIGSELIRRIEAKLPFAYSIDAVCDPNASAFYRKLGYLTLDGQAKRQRERLRPGA